MPGIPVPQARSRFSTLGGVVHSYDTKKCRMYKDLVKVYALEAKKQSKNEDWVDVMVGVPLSMALQLLMPIPARWNKADKASALRGDIAPLSRPDIDNLVKTYLDALTGVFYKDDSQVVSVHAIKRYGSDPSATIILNTDIFI